MPELDVCVCISFLPDGVVFAAFEFVFALVFVLVFALVFALVLASVKFCLLAVE